MNVCGAVGAIVAVGTPEDLQEAEQHRFVAEDRHTVELGVVTLATISPLLVLEVGDERRLGHDPAKAIVALRPID